MFDNFTWFHIIYNISRQCSIIILSIDRARFWDALRLRFHSYYLLSLQLMFIERIYFSLFN